MVKNNANMFMTVAVIFGIVVIAGFGYMIFNMSQGEPDPLDTPAQGCPESTAILTVNAVNALNKGSSMTVDINAGVNGAAVTTDVTSGTTTFPVGAQVTILANASNYIDKSATFNMPCGGKVLELPMFYSTSDNPSIRIKNDEDNFMTNAAAGGAVNQTDLSAGETLSLQVEFKGTSQESSGDGVYIVETAANSGANITRIELDGVAGKAVPTVHASTAAGSAFYSWDVAAIEGSKTVTKDLTIILTTTGDINGAVLTDWYAKQEFVDDNGAVATGIQDSDGTAKYENTLSADFLIDNP